MILADRLISRSSRALSRMIGMRLPGGGAYRGAHEGDATRRRPPIVMSVLSCRFPPPSEFHPVAVYTLRRWFSSSFDTMRRHHEA
jgi:hypothetical protein